jgi:integrase/recombinase XerD
LAAAACLARFKGFSREHTESDLRGYLAWGAERGLDPPAAQRPHVELYIRSMQEIRRARQNLDRHPNYILAVYMASVT